MKLKTIIGALLISTTAILASACGDSGCDKLKSKLEGCGATTTGTCTNDTQADCIADKLDGTCSNLIAASAECA